MNCCNMWLGSWWGQVQYLPQPDVAPLSAQWTTAQSQRLLPLEETSAAAAAAANAMSITKSRDRDEYNPWMDDTPLITTDASFQRKYYSDAPREFLPIYSFRKNRNRLQIFITK